MDCKEIFSGLGPYIQFECGLNMRSELYELSIFQEQHKMHHFEHHTIKEANFQIYLDNISGMAFCSGSCDNGNSILRKMSQEKLCFLNSRETLACGLLFSYSTIYASDSQIIEGHRRHHEEKHMLRSGYGVGTYTIIEDGNCSSACIGPETNQYIDNVKCKIINQTSLIIEHECKLIVPTSVSEMDRYQIGLMHQKHHEERHKPERPVLANKFYTCNCPKESKRKGSLASYKKRKVFI